MAQSLTNGFSGKQLELYTNDYYERSDLVFRFGALMTVSREGAERLTEEAFRLLIEDFSKVGADSSPQKLLMNFAVKAWKKIKSEKFHEWKAPVLQSMKTLGEDQRAALFMIEIAGLELNDAAKILGCDESKFRLLLAGAQKFLATNSVKV
jgi:DNA-directed RNA polymerase specialized sigma24 family protein